MYLPAHFTETDPTEIAGLIELFPLAALVAHVPDGLIANHIPLMMEEGARLIGHIALNNDLHRALPDDSEVLAIFRGDDSYVSPNWYPSKATHHRHVPTWNYEVVHVSGRIRFLHDEKSKTAIVGKLTRRMEARENGPDGWRMADAPRDYMADMLSKIVGFEIAITRTLAKSKLSQNREPADFANVAATLEAKGKSRLSSKMTRSRV